MNDFIEKIANTDEDTCKLSFIELYNVVSQIKNIIKKKCKEKTQKNSDFESPLKFDEKNFFIPTQISQSSIKSFYIKNSPCESNDSISSSDSLSNNTVGKYKLQHILGKGGQGVVYYAKDNKNNEYAIKTIANFNKKYRITQNVKNEIAIMKKINHCNVIKLYDVIHDNAKNIIYIVMQYAKYGSLFKINKDFSCNTFTKKKAKKISRQIINGLNYLHKKNIVHNDIKPDNILLGEDDEIYLSDFGVSEITQGSFTCSRSGTYLFFSPEKFLICCQTYGKSIDIWAFGVTLFAMLYGYLPFIGESYKEIKFNIINEKPNYPSNITETEKSLFDGIFNKDPNERFTIKDIKNHDFYTNKTYDDDKCNCKGNNIEKLKMTSPSIIFDISGLHNSLIDIGNTELDSAIEEI
jgi:serine/threonine protein kinase